MMKNTLAILAFLVAVSPALGYGEPQEAKSFLLIGPAAENADWVPASRLPAEVITAIGSARMRGASAVLIRLREGEVPQVRAFPRGIGEMVRHLCQASAGGDPSALAGIAALPGEADAALGEAAIRGGTTPQAERLAAVQGLARRGVESAGETLGDLAVHMYPGPVRDAALAALVGRASPRIVLQSVRMGGDETRRALEALGRTRDRPATAAVIREVLLRVGSGQRSVMLSATQQAYVRDFTIVTGVETIGADPEIGYAQGGLVQDVKVVALDQYLEALHTILGIEFSSPEEVLRWWNEHRDEFIDELGRPRR